MGVTPLTQIILEQEFPQLKKITVPAYKIKYSSVFPLWLKLLLDLPRLRSVIRAENKILDNIVKENNIEIVISDNRYGLYHPQTKNIVICHQINLVTPFFSSFANSIHQKWLSKFSEIWVPDFKDRAKALAGILSENKLKLNCNYIGPLSRLNKRNAVNAYDILFLLSGPEPDHTQFLNKAIEVCQKLKNKKCIIVTSNNVTSRDGVEVFRSPNSTQLSELIAASKTIVCRSGYSTLMDMFQLGKTDLILVPTKGQTEQEYLAKYWNTKFNAVILSEDKLTDLIK